MFKSNIVEFYIRERRKKMKRPAIIALAIAIMLSEGLVFMLFSNSTHASSTWWDNNWSYRRQITIGPHPENYQINVIIPPDIPKVDYPSIRFLENENSGLLPYWIERAEDSYVNVAWVRRLENSDNSIWMYYGNSSATSAENGDNTFLFWDDFGGANSGKWGETLNRGTITWLTYSVLEAQGNHCQLEHGPGQNIQYLSTQRIIEFRVKPENVWRLGFTPTGPGGFYEEYACLFRKTYPENRFWAKNYVSENNRPSNVWYIFRTELYGDNRDRERSRFYWGNDNGQYRQSLENSNEFTDTWGPEYPRSIDKYNLGEWDDNSSSNYSACYYDWFFVRKYVDPEPTVTIGPKQVPSPPINLVASWNLVSFPVTSESSTPDNLFPGQTYYIWKWSAENKKYVSPSSSAPVELGVGYWIWVGGYGQTITTIGLPVDNYSENLKNGWNLVGFPVTNENTTPDNLFPGQTYYIWRWDAVNKKYVSPQSTAPFELGVGYWIWVDHDQTVNVPL
jgi:hypothetical protein